MKDPKETVVINRDSLLIFMQRILENRSETKSALALKQLQEILEMQNASPEMIDLVKATRRSIPEAKSAANNNPLTEEALRIAFRRAQARRERETLMSSRGRC